MATKNKTVKVCLVFSLDMKHGIRGKYSILNSWHATIILRHLASSIATEIDTILSWWHLANILIRKNTHRSIASGPVYHVCKEVMSGPRWALHTVSRWRWESLWQQLCSHKLKYLSDRALGLNKVKPDTVHTGQLQSVEEQFIERLTSFNSVEHCFLHTEQLIGEWP